MLNEDCSGKQQHDGNVKREVLLNDVQIPHELTAVHNAHIIAEHAVTDEHHQNKKKQ